MFNSVAYENSRGGGIGVLEVVDGTKPAAGKRRFVPDETGVRLFVPLERTELRGEIVGPLAALRLTQIYRFSRAECDRVLEAVYRFPLPGDAAVTSVRVRFGEVEIRAELKAREEAEAAYQQAKREGRQAALVSRESPDVFTLLVAGIEPDQDVVVETSYVQLARAEGAGWSLRVPLTTAPRYVRGDEGGARHAQGQPLGLLRDPGHRFSLDLRLPGASRVESQTHRLQLGAVGDGFHVELADGEVIPNRDFVLSWQPRREQDQATLQVWLHDDRPTGQVYFLALVAPPSGRLVGAGVPREVFLLVDHSGSMAGPKWAAADWAVKKFLAELAEHDVFNLGLFHSTTRWFANAPVPVQTRTRSGAIAFLDQHRDSGGTELGVALEQALDQKRVSGECARHVLIVTDAQVTDEGRLLRLADRESERGDRRRIDLLCIDAAPNSALALELAERGGGVARFLTSSPEEEDITTALDETLVDWAAPVLTGLRLVVHRAGVETVGRDVGPGVDPGWSAIDLGDLPAGRTIWVIGRAAAGDRAELAFRLATGKGCEIAACRLDIDTHTGERPALAALFGARRIAALEFLFHAHYAADEVVSRLARLGYDSAAVLAGPAGRAKKLYAENAQQDVAAALSRLLVEESLTYGLASAGVSFVATRSERGKLVEGTVPVANALPAGWSGDFVGQVAMAMQSPSAGGAGMMRSGWSLGLSDVAADVDTETLAEFDVPALLQKRVARPADHLAKHEIGAIAPAAPLFSGVPVFQQGAAVLFDSTRREDAGKLPERATLSLVQIRFPDGAGPLDPELWLLIFVGDLSSPRARVRLADLASQGGERPLNVKRSPGQPVQILLMDPTGAWAAAASPLEVAIGWED